MTNRIASWDETFASMAETISRRSKDPNTQVGACIVSSDNRVLSMGYNGSPVGMDDMHIPWHVREATAEEPLTKYDLIVHAELNAVLNNRVDMTGGTIYITHYPCGRCATAIVHAGIKRVVYIHEVDYLYDEAAAIILSHTGVTIERYAS